MTSPCDLYATPTTTWPKQQFPADHPAVSRIGQRERIAIKDAWNFFERVETIDAATRVRLGNNGGQIPPHLWYPFRGDGERMLYEKGRRYHILICPTLDWTPQRNLPIPITPLTTVTPADCPCYDSAGCSGEELLLLSRSVPRAEPLSAPATKGRSANLIKEGIPAKVEESHTKIAIVENTPSTPRSAATPTSTGSPHPPGSPASIRTPQSEKADPPALEISEVSTPPTEPAKPSEATELHADRIQLV
jgi:hypothetical protein